MMEENGQAPAVLAPSRIIEAPRSRTTLAHANPSRLMIEQRLDIIATAEGIQPTQGVLGDIAHVSGNNLRKSIFMFQLLAERQLLDQRSNVQLLMSNSTARGSVGA